MTVHLLDTLMLSAAQFGFDPVFITMEGTQSSDAFTEMAKTVRVVPVFFQNGELRPTKAP